MAGTDVGRWLCGLFEPGIVHLPAPGARPRRLRALWVVETLCGRYARRDAPEGPDSHRCPDCAQAETDALAETMPTPAGQSEDEDH